MIKVLHVVGIMDKGGIETLILNVVRHMDRDCFEFAILCTIPGKGAYEPELSKLKVPVHKVGEKFSSCKGKLRYIGQYRTYREWFSTHCFDIVHIHGSHAFDTSIAVKAALDSRSCGAIIAHSHTEFGEHAWLNAFFAQYLARMPITRLSCSEPASKWLYGKKAFSVPIIKNGINVESFRFNKMARERVRSELAIAPTDRVAVHVGRLSPVKNHVFLFKILVRLRSNNAPIKLLLVGDGPEKQRLKDLAEKMGVSESVYFLGLRSDVSAVLAAADIFMMPSFHEGLPLAAVEAQASGLPTLLSSNIAKEAAFTNLAKLLPISPDEKEWVEEVQLLTVFNDNWESARSEAADMVRRAGYDISDAVSDLSDLYMAVFGKARKIER